MLAKVTGDYSNYPEMIRDAMPYLDGELAELRTNWDIYHSLFMDTPEMTAFFKERFGPLLGILQSLIGKEMVLTISCLTDKDSKNQENLSVWILTKAVPFARGKDFAQKVNSQLDSITATASKARKLRHKHVAHYDLEVSLGQKPMPDPLLGELKLALEQMEKLLNLFHVEFTGAEVGFENLPTGMMLETTIETAWKAKVFDELEADQRIPVGELERRMAACPWWRWY